MLSGADYTSLISSVSQGTVELNVSDRENRIYKGPEAGERRWMWGLWED